MSNRTITQTRELCVAVGSIVHDVLKANEDGSISKIEAFKIAVANASDVVTACSGISEVPSEIADITPEELDELYAAVVQKLGWPEKSANREIFDVIYNMVVQGVISWGMIRGILQRAAAVVPEVEGVDPP